MDGKRIIGIDIGKRWLDVAREDAAEVEQHANEAATIAALVGAFDPTRDIVVFERCGGYERELEAALATANGRGRWCIRSGSRHSARFRASRLRLMRSILGCCRALGVTG